MFFLSPTTTKERMKKVIQASSGFVYYVSLTGVTGIRKSLPSNIANQIQLAKQLTNKPICVGFGISTSKQVKAIAKISDGVIVGSAIVSEIEKNKGNKDLVKNVSKFVLNLSRDLWSPNIPRLIRYAEILFDNFGILVGVIRLTSLLADKKGLWCI